MFGKLDRKNWETSASNHCQNLWLTDCNSTSTYFLRLALGRITDRRLAIGVAALRQSLWRWPGHPLGDDTIEDERPPEDKAADVVPWIDTDIMLVDLMTRAMSSEKLYAALDSNYWSLKQPIESVRKKRAKQAQGRRHSVGARSTDHHGRGRESTRTRHRIHLGASCH